MKLSAFLIVYLSNAIFSFLRKREKEREREGERERERERNRIYCELTEFLSCCFLPIFWLCAHHKYYVSLKSVPYLLLKICICKMKK